MHPLSLQYHEHQQEPPLLLLYLLPQHPWPG
jgi:hypothetical protein